MFQKITIYLKVPICNCEKQNFNWGIKHAESSLVVWCATCNTTLTIPYSKLCADFVLEKEYPKGILEKINDIVLNPEITQADRNFLKDLKIKPD